MQGRGYMKAAVTGATGFIGGKLVETLLESGWDVRCLVRNKKSADALRNNNIEIHYGDFGQQDTLTGFTQGADVVFHIAAMVSDWGELQEFRRINVDATRVLLDEAVNNGVRRFVHMSSSTVVWKSSLFEIHDLQDIDEAHPYPESYSDHYNETKAEAEKLVLDYSKSGKIETIVIRPSNVWGEGDTVILPRIVDAARKGLLYPIGYGKKISTPCNINNLASALLLASWKNDASGRIYFINDGVKIGYNRFVSDMLNAAGVEWEPGFTLPYSLMYSAAAVMEFLFRIAGSEKPPVLTRFAVSALAGSRSYSIERAVRELGYRPQTGYEEGMRKLKAWIEDNGGIDSIMKQRK